MADVEQQRLQQEAEERQKKIDETKKKLDERYLQKYEKEIDTSIKRYEQKAWDELDSRFKDVDLRATDKRTYDYPYSTAQINLFKVLGRSSNKFTPYCKVSIYRREFNDFFEIDALFVSSINISNGFGRVGTADIEITTSEDLFKHVNLFDNYSALGRNVRTRWTETHIKLGYGNVYFVVFQGYLVSYEMSVDGESKVKVRFSCVNRLAELENDLARRLGGFKSPVDEGVDQEPDENAPENTTGGPVGTGTNANVVNGGPMATTPQEKQQIDISKLSSLQSIPAPSFWIMYEHVVKAYVNEEDYPPENRVLSAYNLFTTWRGASKHDVQMLFAVMISKDGKKKSELLHINLSKQSLIQRIDMNGEFYFGQYSYDESNDFYIYRVKASGEYRYGHDGMWDAGYKIDFWAIIKKSGLIQTQGGPLFDEADRNEYSWYKRNTFENEHFSELGFDSGYYVPRREYVHGKYNISTITGYKAEVHDITPLKITSEEIEIPGFKDEDEPKGSIYLDSLGNKPSEEVHRTDKFWRYSHGLAFYQMTVEGYTFKLFKGGVARKMELVSSVVVDKKWWNHLIYGVPPEELNESFRAEAIFQHPKEGDLKKYPRPNITPFLHASTGVGRNWFLMYGPYLLHLNFKKKNMNISQVPPEISSRGFNTYMFTSKKEMMFVSRFTLQKTYQDPYAGQDAIIHKMSYEGTPMQASMEEEFRDIVKENPDPTSKTKRSEELREKAEEKVNNSVVPTPRYTPNPNNNGAANGDGYGIYVDNGSGIFFRGSFRPAPTPDYLFDEGVDLLSISYASDDTIYSKVEVFSSGATAIQTRPAAYVGETGETLQLYRPDLSYEEAVALAKAYMQGNLADTVEIETRFVPLLDVGKTVGVRCKDRLGDSFMGIIKESSISYTDEGVWMKLILKVYDYRILFEDVIGVNPIQKLQENAVAKGLPIYKGS